MLLVGLLMYSFIYVSKSILQMSNVNELVVLNLLTCLGGAYMCAKATPRGFVEMFKWVGRLPLRPDLRRSLKDRLAQNQMETRVYQERLQSVDRSLTMLDNQSMSQSAVLVPVTAPSLAGSAHRLYASMNGGSNFDNVSEFRGQPQRRRTEAALLQSRTEIHVRLKQLDTERRQMQKDLSQSPLSRNLTFLLLFLVSHFVWFLLIGYLTFNLIKGLFDHEDEQQQQQKFESIIGRQTTSLLSMFGTVGTLTEIILILCFNLATIIGVYVIPPFRRLRPRRNRMTVQQTIANVVLLLIISSSLPALVRVLGLTRFEHTGPYENFHVLKNRYWIRLLFRASVLFKMVFDLLDHYVLGSVQLVRQSMTSSRRSGNGSGSNSNGGGERREQSAKGKAMHYQENIPSTQLFNPLTAATMNGHFANGHGHANRYINGYANGQHAYEYVSKSVSS
jgi:hypothetical protein